MLANMPKATTHSSSPHTGPQLETLGLLTSGVAHDFNNILTSIMGQASLALIKLPKDNDARQHIEKAIQAAEMAALLTQQLLNLAKGEMLEEEPVNLNELIAENKALLQMLLPDNVSLRVEFTAETPLIYARKPELQQVLLNLIINAVEALESKQGVITIRTSLKSRSNLGLEDGFRNRKLDFPDGFIILQVSDTGKGMDKDTLSRIFDPFFTTKSSGKGVGLATVQRIVASYSGGISVDSDVGKGTTFTIFLPYYLSLSNIH